MIETFTGQTFAKMKTAAFQIPRSELGAQGEFQARLCICFHVQESFSTFAVFQI